MVNTFDLIKAMIDISPKNDVRHYLNGIHLSRGDDSAVVIEATCGHTLLRLDVPAPDTEQLSFMPITNVVLCRHSAAKILKLFSHKEPPVISADESTVYFGDYEVETIEGRFPDTNRLLSQRTGQTLTANPQGVKLDILSRAAKATSKLVPTAVFSAYDAQGFSFTRDTEAGRVTAIVMPCRL